MTTREIYFKNVIQSDLPVGFVGYTVRDSDNIIRIGRVVALELRTDEQTISNSLKQMEKIEQSEGFMFWNTSIEGEKFFEENGTKISGCLSFIIQNQK